MAGCLGHMRRENKVQDATLQVFVLHCLMLLQQRKVVYFIS